MDDDRHNCNILIAGWNASQNYGTTLQSLALYSVLSARYSCSLLWERRHLSLSAVIRHFAVRKFDPDKPTQIDAQKQERILDCYQAVDKTYINSRKALRAALDRFSVFLVGGDQLWNPYLLENTFMLDFVPKNRRKISYGTSTGMTKLPDFAVKRYKKYLSGFDRIAVREKGGAEALSVAIGKPVDVVCDPVFLLTADEWTQFACPEVDCGTQKYALFYFVGDNSDNRRKAEQLACDQNLPIVIIPMREAGGEIGERMRGIGPREFVRLVINAAHIYTDSFHMCAFSLIFGKSFSVFRRFTYDSEFNPNCRIDELLGRFGFEPGRCTVQPTAADIDTFNRIISSERERSLGILFSAIEGDNTD